MVDEKVLVLSDNINSIYSFEGSIDYISLGTRTDRLKKGLFYLIYNLGLARFLYAKKLDKLILDGYDTIVVLETNFPVQFIEYIRSCNQHCKIIFWLSNSLGKRNTPFFNNSKEDIELIKNRDKYNFKIISFDKGDCTKFQLIFIKQCVPRLDFGKNGSATPVYDVVFVGYAKDRLQYLINLYEYFEAHGFICKMIIYPSKKMSSYSEKEQKFLFDGPMLRYEDVVKLDMASKAILDIVQKGQRGITWRPVEAAYYSRKLITNFLNIKNYDLYDCDNVFILGEDDLGCLEEFINSPVKEISDDIKDSYTFNSMLKSIK